MTVEPGNLDGGDVAPSSASRRIMDLYEAFYDKIHSYCTYRLFKRELVQDATSAVFTRMIEAFDILKDKSQNEICDWLYGAANTIITNQLRTRKRRLEILQDVARHHEKRQTGNPFLDKLDWPVLYGAILNLRLEQQNVVVLRYFEDLELDEVGRRLGMKPVTVRVTLSRAIHKLRRELGACHEA